MNVLENVWKYAMQQNVNWCPSRNEFIEFLNIARKQQIKIEALEAALKPFSEAFEKFGKWHYTDHEDREKWFAFHDSNSALPTQELMMGEFRKAFEALTGEPL
jgi:hypothetical protein